jgi:hypothetical protein
MSALALTLALVKRAAVLEEIELARERLASRKQQLLSQKRRLTELQESLGKEKSLDQPSATDERTPASRSLPDAACLLVLALCHIRAPVSFRCSQR